MDEPSALSFDYSRTFGAEFEILAFDKRDFKKHPLGRGDMPDGIYEVSDVVLSVVKKPVEVKKWHITNNNIEWVLKPDSSCGIEVCAPPVKGWNGLKSVCEVVEAFKNDKRIEVDNRCSFHLHVDCADLSDLEIGKILAYWIKCESVFLDSVPATRKRNKYCQQIGISNLFEHDKHYVAKELMGILGYTKYYSINTFHINRGNRRTIEFRIGEGEGCKNPFLIKNWIRLLVHFVEMAIRMPFPSSYQSGVPMSGLLWLDPKEVFGLLGFSGNYKLSKGLAETRNWFLARLSKNLYNTGLPGVWSDGARKIAKYQVDEMITQLELDEQMPELLNPTDVKKALYSQENKI